MIPSRFAYHRATSVSDALEALSVGGDEARPLAGGQSLVALLKLRLARPSMIVDLAGVTDLHRLSSEDGLVSVGAMVSHDTVLRRLPEMTGHLAFSDAGRVLGDRQIRSRGTLIGALAHADPRGDWLAVGLAVGFDVHVVGPASRRIVPIADLFGGPFTTTVGTGELIERVEIPIATPQQRSAYVKIADPASGYALAGTCAVLSTEGGEVVQAAVALVGVNSVARRLPSVEAALRDGHDAASATRHLLDDIEPDVAGPDARHRLQLAQVATRRSIETALSRTPAIGQ